MKHFVMSVDPGVTCGISFMVFQKVPEEDSIAALTATQKRCKDSDRSRTYGYEHMGIELYAMWEKAIFVAREEYGIGKAHCRLAIEDFQLRPQYRSQTKDVLSPVYVSAAFVGAILGVTMSEKRIGANEAYVPEIHYGQPTQKAVINNARLRSAGIWVSGDHAQDAVRHSIILGRKLGHTKLLARRPEAPEPFPVVL